MDITEDLVARNTDFADNKFETGLRMKPKLSTIVIGCVDARVDPAVVLGTEQGEIMAIRNVGGRATPRTLEELFILRNVAQGVGDDIDSQWQLIVMRHTQCGITKIQDRESLLAPYFEVAKDDLDAVSIDAPYAAVARDVSLLCAEKRLGDVRVAGLVYDVTTGRVETVTEI